MVNWAGSNLSFCTARDVDGRCLGNDGLSRQEERKESGLANLLKKALPAAKIKPSFSNTTLLTHQYNLSR